MIGAPVDEPGHPSEREQERVEMTSMTTSEPTSDLPVIEFIHPMPGFSDQRRFALVQLDEAGMLSAMRSLDDPGLRFLVMPAAPFFPDYHPVVGDEVVDDLGIESVDDTLLLLVLTAGRSLETSTANLAAPVVINLRTRRAQQVVLEGQDFEVAAPLVAS
ncbi:MAG: flagellar assembly protein FliW [Actinomycetota bacterium]|nr:flagellar assembly protein FliW [Actinomycetota bacterium]